MLELEKLVKKVIRKSLKNNTLDYTVQISVSSLDPGKLQYAAHISSPASGVSQITYIYDTFDLLLAALKESEKSFSPEKVEIAFHTNRINMYKNKAAQHEKRVEQLNDPDYDPKKELEDLLGEIPMEEVKTDE